MKKISLVAGLLAATAAGFAWAAEPAPPASPAPAGDLATIMVDLGLRMTEAQTGLWSDDLAAIQRAATAVANHPRVSAEERQRVQAALGADFAGFAKADHAVHEGALRLAEASAAGDADATVKALGALQADCVACHTSYRARLTR